VKNAKNVPWRKFNVEVQEVGGETKAYPGGKGDTGGKREKKTARSGEQKAGPYLLGLGT